MTAKEYLSEIQKMRRLLHSLELRAEELRTQAEGVKAMRYDRDKVQVSPTNMMEELAPLLVEVEEEYGRQIVKYHEAVLIRIRQIEALSAQSAELLTLRYIDGLSLWKVSKRMHLSFDRVRHLHGIALEEFRKRWRKLKDDTF